MDNSAKPRSEHRGQPAPHLGQDHFEKSLIQRAAQIAGRKRELVNQLNDLVLRNMISLSQRGYSTREVVEALKLVCSEQDHALEEDPDPADDPQT